MQQFGEFVVNHWDLFLALALILMMLYGGTISSRMSGFNHIDPTGTVRLMSHDDALLLDVREDGEFAEGHIAGAHHIPLGSLTSRLTELDSAKQRPVVVACRSGHRSGVACRQLRKQGFEQVYNLRGGMMAWQNASLPVDRGGNGKKRKGKKA